MPRIRSIHPGLFTDEAFVSVSDAARVLLLALGCHSDYHDRINLPLDHDAIRNFDDIAALVDALRGAGLFIGGIARGRIVGEITFRFGHPRRAPSGWERLRQQVFKRDGYCCVYCGSSSSLLHADHIIPVSKGGIDRLDNLATACKFCNLSKGNRPLPRARAR